MKQLLFMLGFGFQEIIAILFTLVLPIGIFFLLRPLMLWYWKVDTKINLMKDQNQLLNDIRTTLRENKDRLQK